MYDAGEGRRESQFERYPLEGSLAVALVLRADLDPGVVRGPEERGALYTRTGRSFFSDAATTADFLARLARAADSAGLFTELDSDWVLLDAELLPWLAKAGELIRSQYAAVGAAACAAVPAAVQVLELAAARGLDVAPLLELQQDRATDAVLFTDTYRRYCWPTDGLDGVAIAPFQVLASAGQTFHTREDAWHLAVADRLHHADPQLVRTTAHRYVDATDPASETAPTGWWTEVTAAGGEGMVVKPAANFAKGRRGVAQPGLKVRGREYLWIKYGPDYTRQEHLERLRERNLGRKRGLEALDRAARGEPLWRVHECVFAVLALESEPVDPRL